MSSILPKLAIMLSTVFVLMAIPGTAQDTLLLRLVVKSHNSNAVAQDAEVLVDKQPAKYNSQTECYEVKTPGERFVSIQITEPGAEPCSFTYYHSFSLNPRGQLDILLGNSSCSYLRTGFMIHAVSPDKYCIGIAKNDTDMTWKTTPALLALLDRLGLTVDSSNHTLKSVLPLGSQPRVKIPFLVIRKKSGEPFADKNCAEIIALEKGGYITGVFLDENGPLYSGPLTIETFNLSPANQKAFLTSHQLELVKKDQEVLVVSMPAGMGTGMVDLVNSLYENKVVKAIYMTSFDGIGHRFNEK